MYGQVHLHESGKWDYITSGAFVIMIYHCSGIMHMLLASIFLQCSAAIRSIPLG